MEQRVLRVSGTFTVESAPGEGTAVSASVPAIPAEAGAASDPARADRTVIDAADPDRTDADPDRTDMGASPDRTAVDSRLARTGTAVAKDRGVR